MRVIKILILLLFPVSGFAQQVTWDVSLWGKRRAFTEHVEKLSELVAQKTNGEFMLKLSYGGLSKPKENLDGISTGAFEMAQFCAGYHKEKNPSITVLELPFLGVSTLAQERVISQWLYRHPSVRSDFRKWNAIALMPSPLPQYNLIGVGEKPSSLSQLAGLQVRATGGIGNAMEALGATPSPIIATEVRQALETGQINAVAFAPHAHMSFGTIANAAWWTTNLNPGTVNCPVVANIDALRSLSETHRNALYSSINEALDYYIAHYEYNMRESWEPVLSELGIEKVTFNDLELGYFRERVEKPAALAWIAENQSRGLPAEELYNLVKVALTGENPERTMLSGSSFAQPATVDESLVSKKQQILQAYSFDKKTGAQPEESGTLLSDGLNALVPADSTLELAVTEPAITEPAITEPASDQTIIDGGVSALFVNDRLTGNSVSTAEVNAPAVETISTQSGNYFGVPRNGADTAFEADPLKLQVEWDLKQDVTVGSTLASLSDYIGYQLVTTDQTAINVYGLNLPMIQRKVDRIAVGDAFQVLSGRGLVTVFDHTSRTVKHVPMKRQGAGNIPPCPADLDVGVRTGDGVLLLPDGGQCSY